MIALAAGLVGLAVWLALVGTPDVRRVSAVPSASGDRGSLPRWLRGRDDALALRTRVLAGALVGLGLLLGVGGALGLAAAAAGALAVLVLSGEIETGAARKDQAGQLGQLAGTLDLLAAALAAGAAPRVAASAVADVSLEPTKSALRVVTGETDIGRSDAEAWRVLGTHPRWTKVWGRVARDLSRSARSGVAVEEVLRMHAQMARAERRATLEKKARAVGVSSVMPLMACFLPAFMAVGVAPIVLGLGMQYLR